MHSNYSTNDSLTESFSSYLESLGISSISLRNYFSDVFHFSAWFQLKLNSLGMKIQNLSEAVPFLNSTFVVEYRNYLVHNKSSIKTINRRLSTLRHLSRFLILSQILNFDFMEGLSNMDVFSGRNLLAYPLLAQFEKHLKEENISHNTIKNYLSDIKHFISWLDKQNQVNMKLRELTLAASSPLCLAEQNPPKQKFLRIHSLDFARGFLRRWINK
jgi:site-specific recombinase XerD